MGREKKKANPILFCFLILTCHLIPSFLWPFVSAGFHGNNNQQAVCIPLSSLRTENSKQGQNQLWVEEGSRRFPSFSLMLMCAFLKVSVHFCALISVVLAASDFFFFLDRVFVPDLGEGNSDFHMQSHFWEHTDTWFVQHGKNKENPVILQKKK